MPRHRILYSPSGRAGEYANKGLACNLYSGCIHGCRYCYVPGIQRRLRGQFHETSVPVKNDPLGRLEHDCRVLHDEPIFLSFTSDIFQPEPCQWITQEALQIIKSSGNRVRILTKGCVTRQALELLGPGDELGVTLTMHTEQDAKTWEPNAANYGVRIFNLQRAKERGIHTWASFEPVIDPEQTLQLIKLAAPYIDIAKIGMANHLNQWDWPSQEWRERVESIDWPDFRRRAIELCESLGLNYYIKADLREAR